MFKSLIYIFTFASHKNYPRRSWDHIIFSPWNLSHGLHSELKILPYVLIYTFIVGPVSPPWIAVICMLSAFVLRFGTTKWDLSNSHSALKILGVQ